MTMSMMQAGQMVAMAMSRADRVDTVLEGCA